MSDRHKLLTPRTTTSRRHGSSDSDSEYGQPRKIFRNQHYKSTSSNNNNNNNNNSGSNNRGSENRRSSGSSSSNYHHRNHYQNNSYSKSNHKSNDSTSTTTTRTTTTTTNKKSSSSGGGGGSEKYDPFADIELDPLSKKNGKKEDCGGKYDATKDLLKEVDDDLILQLVMGQQDISAESLLQSIGHSEPLLQISSSSTTTTLKNFKSDKKSVKVYSPSSTSTSSSSASSSRAPTPTSPSTTINNIITTPIVVVGKKGTNLPKLKSTSSSLSENLKEPHKITNLLSFLESDNLMDKLDFDDELTTHLVKCQKVQKVSTNTTTSNTNDHHHNNNSNIFNSQNSKLSNKYTKNNITNNEYSPDNNNIKKKTNKEKINTSNKDSSSGGGSSSNNNTSPTTQKHPVLSPSNINSVFKNENVLTNKSRTPPLPPPPSHSNSNSRSTTPSKSPASSSGRSSSSTSHSKSRSKSPPPGLQTITSPKILLDSNNRSSRSKTPPMKMSSSSSKHYSRIKSDSRSKSPLIPSSSSKSSTSSSDKKENDSKRSRSKSRSRTPSRSRSNSDRKRFKYRSSRSRSRSKSRSKSPPPSSSRHYNTKSRKYHRSRSRSRSISPNRHPRNHNIQYNNHHNNNRGRIHPNGRYSGSGRERDRGRDRSVERIQRQSVRDSPRDDRTDRISSRHDRNHHHQESNRQRNQDDYRRGDDKSEINHRDRAPGYSRHHHSYKSHDKNSMRRPDSSAERALRIQEAMEGYDGPRHPHMYRDHKSIYVNGRGIDHFLPPLPNSHTKHSDSTPLSHESTSPQQLQSNVADSTISDSELAETCGQFLSSHNNIESNDIMCQQDPNERTWTNLDERLEMEMGIKLREEPYRSTQPFHYMTGAYGRKHGTNNNNSNSGRFPPLPPDGHIAQTSQPRLISQAIQNGDEFQIIPGEIPEKPFTVSKHNAKLNPIQVQTANYVIPQQGDGDIIKKVTIKLPVVPFKFYLPKSDFEQYVQQQQQYLTERAHSTKHSYRSRQKSHKKKKEKVVVMVESQQEVSDNVSLDVSNETEVNENSASETKSISEMEADETAMRPDDMAEADEQEEETTTRSTVPDSPTPPVYTSKVPPLPDALPLKGILLVAGFSERIFKDNDKSSKGVKFLDGIAPGYGTSRSEGEDMGCSPPPTSQNDLLIKKKNKEKRRKIRKARRLEKERLKNQSNVSADDDVENKMSELKVSSPPPPPPFSYPYCPLHVLYQFNPSYAILCAQGMAENGFEVTFEPTYDVDDERLPVEGDHVFNTSFTNEIIMASDPNPNFMDTLDDSNLLKVNL